MWFRAGAGLSGITGLLKSCSLSYFTTPKRGKRPNTTQILDLFYNKSVSYIPVIFRVVGVFNSDLIST